MNQEYQWIEDAILNGVALDRISIRDFHIYQLEVMKDLIKLRDDLKELKND